MNIRKFHYFSGVVLTIFIGFHLLNHFMILFGVERHLAIMESFRKVYRFIVVEIFIVAAALLQVYSGIQLILQVRKRTKTTFFDYVQYYSGLYLAFFILFHLAAVFSGRILFHLDTNTYFGIAGLNTFPYFFMFIPYYFLAVFSFFAHIAAIHSKKMKRTLLGFSPEVQSKIILVKAFVIACLLMLVLTDWGRGFEIIGKVKELYKWPL